MDTISIYRTTAERGDRTDTNRADIALYKAKAAGRNCTVHFTEILKRHGRVLEADIHNRTVAIDIGAKVDVKVGHEFFVFGNKYRGGVPFNYSDGRSNRIIGEYPRKHFARIEVFDVQSDLSFCEFRENLGIDHISEGSVLEFVPIGKIEGLVEFEDIHHEVDTRNYIETIISSGQLPVAVSLKIDSIDHFIDKFGVGRANRYFANMINSLKKIVGPDTVLGHIESELILVFPSSSWNCFEALKDFSTTFSEGNLVGSNVKIGISPVNRENDVINDKTLINHDNVLLLSRFARESLVYHPSNSGQVLEVNAAALYSLVTELRISGNLDRAFEYFERILEMGVCRAEIFNQAALVCRTRGDITNAIQMVRKSLIIEPDNKYYVGNIGVFYRLDHQYSKSFKYFVYLEYLLEYRSWTTSYVLGIGYAAMKMFKDGEWIGSRSRLEKVVKLSLGAGLNHSDEYLELINFSNKQNFHEM